MGHGMARYIWRDGEFRDRLTGEAMDKPYAGQIVLPAVLSDIPEYRSPIDGQPITSRSHRREDLKRNNCVEYEPSMKPKSEKFEAFEERRQRAIAEAR